MAAFPILAALAGVTGVGAVGAVGAGVMVVSLGYWGCHRSNSAETVALLDGKVRRANSEKDSQKKRDSEQGDLSGDADSPECTLIRCWSEGLSYGEIMKEASVLFGENFIDAYASVPRTRIRGPLNSQNCKTLSSHIQARCKSTKAAEWLSGFLSLFIDKTEVHTRITYKLTIEDCGAPSLCILFVAELVITAEPEGPEVVQTTEDVVEHENAAGANEASAENVYFSCAAIEYRPPAKEFLF